MASAAGGFAIDLTDGWSGCSLRGDARRAFAYLSELRLPASGFIQGDVLRVPVRVLVHEDRLDLLVASPWSHYLRTELREALRGIELQDDLVSP